MDHLSKSQISLYLDCSLKYKFQYVEKLPKSSQPSGLTFGSCIHSSIEWLHKQKMIGKPVTLEALYRIFASDWFCQKSEISISYKNGETEDTLLLKGKEILNLYFQDPVKKPVAAEYPFEVPLINQENGEKLELPLQGIIDLVEDNDGIVEFKTGAKAMDKQSVANNLQLTIYAYAYWILFQKEPKSLKIINFIKNKNPKIEILETTREQKDFQRLYYLAQEVLKGIKAQIFFPHFSFLCADCEYAHCCREWEGN
jgi:putative RecB family exonuclease